MPSILRKLPVCVAVLFLCAAPARAASVTVAWDANTEADIAGYVVHYGTQPGTYTAAVDVGNRTEYTFTSLPAATYYFIVTAYDSNGLVSAPSGEISARVSATGVATVTADFDGDQKSDLAVWRASTGTWYWTTSSSGYVNGGSKQWGSQTLGDVPFTADIDGDGKADLIVWRASTGTWYWLTSSSGYDYAKAASKPWGSLALGDVPMVADVDGDGKADLIVWRATTGTWYWLTSSSGYDYSKAGSRQWGSQALGDMPFTGDFDGDGKADFAVWRPGTGTWYWVTSSSNYSSASAGSRQWGSHTLGDVPMLADMDGDGKSDLVVWRPSSGVWYWLTSSTGFSYAAAQSTPFGSQTSGDVPLLADIDGDGKADPTVWRASTGTWYWASSSAHYLNGSSTAFGSAALGDTPVVH